MAALAAGNQGKFWEFHDRLFINYDQLNDQNIKKIAIDLGFDTAEFEKQTRDPEILTKIRQDIQDANQVGVNRVPTIFINGRRLKNWSPEGFQIIIDKELKKNLK